MRLLIINYARRQKIRRQYLSVHKMVVCRRVDRIRKVGPEFIIQIVHIRPPLFSSAQVGQIIYYKRNVGMLVRSNLIHLSNKIKSTEGVIVLSRNICIVDRPVILNIPK